MIDVASRTYYKHKITMTLFVGYIAGISEYACMKSCSFRYMDNALISTFCSDET